MQNPSAAKRQKERARQEKQRDKEAERAQRRKDKSTRTTNAEGEDPDLAGIIPGPQPPQEDEE
jgi:sRNA-binding protein